MHFNLVPELLQSMPEDIQASSLRKWTDEDGLHAKSGGRNGRAGDQRNRYACIRHLPDYEGGSVDDEKRLSAKFEKVDLFCAELQCRPTRSEIHLSAPKKRDCNFECRSAPRHGELIF